MRLPAHGWLGFLLVAVCWPLNWMLPGLRTHLLFFPLWLGYCLIVDALVLRRDGDSLLRRNPRCYVGMFVASAPAWWLFEALNLRTGNWVYLGREQFSAAQYAVLASVAFSTVIPAIFGTAELLRGTRCMRRAASGRPILQAAWVPLAMSVAGAVMLALVLAWPRLFFPLVWVSLWLMLEPVNRWLGYRTLLACLRRGDWGAPLALAGAALVCGGFWELWNWHAYPKWVYVIPYLDILHVFEMPLPGYGGYLPFAFELFAIYHLVTGLFGDRCHDYLHL